MTLQVYREDEGMTIFKNDGSVTRLTPEETEHIDRVAHHYNKHVREDVPTRPFELARIFPESKTYLLARNKEIAEELQKLQDQDRKISAKLMAFKDKELREEMLRKNEDKRFYLNAERDRNKEVLSCMGTKGKRIRDFNMELERARDYPIDRLIKFTRLKAKCIWHTDRSPSLHYYKKKNKVYCFSCKKGGDVFDVVMQLNNCNLKEAISFLNGE